jgi:hypothetical protein
VEVNAFRIVPDAGDSFFLDFIHYSPVGPTATVLHRVRMMEDAMQSTRERLESDLVEVVSTDLTWPAGSMVN